MKNYLSVSSAATYEKVIERSRFIANCAHVESEEEAKAFIAAVKAEHSLATHNCYAFVADKAGNLMRFSDDGEPQGTAGMPILDVLKNKKLFETAVVVTRYFGGIKLGAGGLVRAYTHGAKIAVDAGGAVEMRLCDRALIRCDYPQYGRVASLVPEAGGLVADTRYTDRVEVEFLLPRGLREPMQKKLTELSAGALHIEVTGEEYAPFSPPAP